MCVTARVVVDAVVVTRVVVGAVVVTRVVVGAVVGGAVGNQVGSGDGKTAATVAGAVVGGIVGNNVEKNRAGGTWYELHVLMADGRTVTVTQDDLNGIREGTRVRLRDGRAYLD